MATSSSRKMVGSTSNFNPTSIYCTLPVTTLAPTLVGVTAFVITGTRSPIRILAFS